MLSDFILVGVHHSTCPLEVREAMSFSPEDAYEVLSKLLSEEVVSEAMILSTCNRTELYAVGAELETLIPRLATLKRISPESLNQYLYQFDGFGACEHIFRVASGLDSMVLGETQIVGQLKNAYRIAEDVGTLGPVLRTTLQSSYSTAKVVRDKTKIGSNAVSLPSVSFRVARQIFGDLTQSGVLFIGAGEMIRLCAEYFSSATGTKFSFVNRTLEKAHKLAVEFGGFSFTIDTLYAQIQRHDVIVSCTGSQTPIIAKGLLEHCLRERGRRPILLIDLAVPRDIEKNIGELEDVFLYTIDDLGEIVRQGQADREAAAREAHKYIEDGLLQLSAEFARRQISPTIKAFRDLGEKIAAEELESAMRLLEKGESPEQAIKFLSRSMAKKFMHQPSYVINSADEKDKEVLAQALRTLYGLNI